MSLKNFKPLDLKTSIAGDKTLWHELAKAGLDLDWRKKLGAWQKKIPEWNELANEAARPEKLPRLEKYDRVGMPREQIVLPLETKTIRREVVETGIWENHSEVEKFAKVYLLAQMGESGVACPLACTDGLIRILQAQGAEDLQKKYLPQLLSSLTPLAGAQFITEQSGGSDVGAIEGRAVKNPDGSWGLYAEKWYCSVADEFFLVLARPEGAEAGTKGLALFFVPRMIQKNDVMVPNGLSYKRLKNKMGTQSLPTAEIDFTGASAFLIGKKEDGFYNLMHYILNVSRLHNAANCLGILRRAFAEAKNYASQREAFGKPIVEYPLIQQSLTELEFKLDSKMALFFSLLKRLDQNGLVPHNREENYWQRFLINLCKYRTAVTLTQDVKEAILIFGANGIVEDFSVLPRLLRDAVILETWEGTHNVLCLQILRDALRFDFWTRFDAEVQALLALWPEGKNADARRSFYDQFKSLELTALTGSFKNEELVARHARNWVDQMGQILETGSFYVNQTRPSP